MSTFDSLEEGSLSIDWAMSLPAIQPKKWHRWEPLVFTDAYTKLEDALDWPHGTLEVLEKAFELRLSRSVGWDLERVSQKDPWTSAAAIFRRGVAIEGQREELVAGRYPVRFQATGTAPHSPAGPCLFDATVVRAWRLAPAPGDLVMDLNESLKSLETVATIKSWLKRYPGTLTIIGGGILADTGAFAAALMGRPFRLVPTTLLAMLDACIGGKTGVNFGIYGKNQLGLFAFPTEVLVYPAWLKTLDEREYRAGLAEGYKHALIKGDPLLATSVAQLPLPHTLEAIVPHLPALVGVKAEIIHEDPNETGKRAVLNFGHTLAHALEKISQEKRPKDPLLHGEAIGIGMLFALYLSRALQQLDPSIYDSITSEIKASTFLIKPDAFRNHLGVDKGADYDLTSALLEAIMQDKKNQEDGASEWIVMKDWGVFVQTKALYTVSVPHERLKKIIDSFFTDSGL